MVKLAIIGATGKTGKWALKGAVQRGWTVKILARSQTKVDGMLTNLFGDDQTRSKITVVQGSISDVEKLSELCDDVEVVISFLGMVNPPEWVVRPGVEAIMKAVETKEKPPKFISMSSIALGDSLQQGRKAWGRAVVWLTLRVFLKAVFQDMQAAEDYMLQNRKDLNIIILRATILEDKKTI